MTDTLLLMDFQEGICRPDGRLGSNGMGLQVEERSVLENAASVLSQFREHGRPIVFVRVAFDVQYSRLSSASPRFAGFKEHKMMVEGSSEAEICAEIAPIAGEPVVSKGCVIPFISTNLTSILTRLSASHLIMGGVATNMVVEGAARYAADAGYTVTILEDLCAAATSEAHDYSIRKILPAFASISTSAAYLETL